MLVSLLITLASSLVKSSQIAVYLRLRRRTGVGHRDVALTRSSVSDWRHILLLCVCVTSVLAAILVNYLRPGLLLNRTMANLGGQIILAGSYLAKPLVKIILAVPSDVLVDLRLAWVS